MIVLQIAQVKDDADDDDDNNNKDDDDDDNNKDDDDDDDYDAERRDMHDWNCESLLRSKTGRTNTMLDIITREIIFI